MIEYTKIILLTLFYLIPLFVCLFDLFNKNRFYDFFRNYSETPFFNTWSIIYCFIPFANFYEMLWIFLGMPRFVNTYDDLKKIPSIRYKLRFYLVIIGFIFSYLYLSVPGEIVVNEATEIKGLQNKTRAVIQGKRFWKDQIRAINHELEMQLSEPRRREELDREMRKIEETFNRSWDEVLRKSPKLRPTPTQRQVKELRNQAKELKKRADQLEEDEIRLLLERKRLERIAELRRILSMIKTRAE